MGVSGAGVRRLRWRGSGRLVRAKVASTFGHCDVAGLSADDSEPSLAQRRARGRSARRPFESNGKRLRGAQFGVALGTGENRLHSSDQPL